MGSLCRWCKKNIVLNKICLGLFLTIVGINLGCLFCVLRIGNAKWTNIYLEYCPLLPFAWMLAACIYKVIPIFNFEMTSILLEVLYYVIWGIPVFSAFLSLCTKKHGKYITCVLFVVDLVIHIITRQYPIVLVDTIFLLLFYFGTRKTDERQGTVLCLDEN